MNLCGILVLVNDPCCDQSIHLSCGVFHITERGHKPGLVL